ncbi:hypothetical protein TREES_T100002810 [Tupaia chinensis]|uniref:Uncharacterized protein n=1 Tax=Tupaia chinensis TaxID=246437 RepID=L9L247_TUPCH|nr:hypothetical protein TREES_T100002810 [Tupaia chinensis]
MFTTCCDDIRVFTPSAFTKQGGRSNELGLEKKKKRKRDRERKKKEKKEKKRRRRKETSRKASQRKGLLDLV